MFFPSPITTLKLRVTQGSTTYEQSIPSAVIGSNSVLITNTNLINAFNNYSNGTIFIPSVDATYEHPLYPSGNEVSNPSASNYVPTPSLSLADIPDKLTTDASFSVASLVSKTGTGVLSYSSSNTSVATVNSSTGQVTIVGTGTTTITVSLAASADGIWAAATPVSKTLTIDKDIPDLSLADIPDKLTTDASFSVASLVSSESTGVLSYSSSNTSVATVNSSTGQVTIVGAGTVTITVNQAASSDGVYAATLASSQFEISEPVISTIVASYPFDSNGNDNSINGNHLTIFNSVTFNTSNYKQGNGAASFNGSNYFQCTNDGRFSPDNFTIACWIKPVNSAGNYQSIATCRDSPTPNLSGWIIYINPSNNLQFWTGSNWYWSGNDDTLFPEFGNLNRWVHIAFTFTKASGSLLVYIDGSLTTTVSRSYINTTNNSLRIGAGATEESANFFLRNGTLLDDFQFYNSVLSASDINSIVSSSL